MPFAWSGVNLYAVGASTLRVRFSADRGGHDLDFAEDPMGVPVANIESLATRAMSLSSLMRLKARMGARCMSWSGSRLRRRRF